MRGLRPENWKSGKAIEMGHKLLDVTDMFPMLKMKM
jgi:hypothetical protein